MVQTKKLLLAYLLSKGVLITDSAFHASYVQRMEGWRRLFRLCIAIFVG